MKKKTKKVKRKTRKEKKFSLKREYKLCWDYLKESKKYIYFATIIFFVFALIGFFVMPPEAVTKQILDFLNQILERTQGLSATELISFIFFNNLQTSFVGMSLGVLFGLFPLFSLMFNGYILGFVAAMSMKSQGALVLLKLLPHGIFELPAVLISLGIGLKLGSFMFYKDKVKTLTRFLISSLKVFFYISIPLLLIAGIIEGTLISLFS